MTIIFACACFSILLFNLFTNNQNKYFFSVREVDNKRKISNLRSKIIKEKKRWRKNNNRLNGTMLSLEEAVNKIMKSIKEIDSDEELESQDGVSSIQVFKMKIGGLQSDFKKFKDDVEWLRQRMYRMDSSVQINVSLSLFNFSI